jgi:gliding motility-associated-like protein
VKSSIIKIIFFYVLLLGSYITCNGDHLMGSDLSYKCLGGNSYEINFKIYRNCNSLNNNIDQEAVITVFNKNNNSYVRTFSIPLINQTNIPNPPSTPCFDAPLQSEVCVQLLQYKGTVNLPASTSSYLLVYQRCCRNPDITNVFNVGSIGSTLQLEIPSSTVAACNSSPSFNLNAPNFICIFKQESIDFSATDTDGDRLVYSLCAPKEGLDFNCPVISNNNQCGLVRATPPPYNDVSYNNSFSSLQPFGNTSPVRIDSTTGMLSIFAKTLGKFTVGVCVKEYRNGVLIGQISRDYQFNTVECNSNEPRTGLDTTGINGATAINDDVYSNCQGATARFVNYGRNSSSDTYFWDFGITNRLDDTSTLASPSFAYPDTGTYIVRLIINKGKACSDTDDFKLIYYPGLKVNYGFSPANCQNDLVLFSDSSTSVYNDINKWQWVFAAGDTAFVKNPTKVYTSSGAYNVTLTTTTSRGCVGKVSKTVIVNPKPKAAFNANYLCYKHNATFTDASTISTGIITKYNWDFGDGQSDTLKNTSHVYNVFADSFPVRHIVTSALGCRDTIIKKIKMDDTVKISYTTAPASICEKLPVTFTNTSIGGNPVAFQWIINNGTSVNGNSTSSTFQTGGIFPVKLISTNRCGIDTLNSTVKINSNPVVNLGSDVTVCNKSTKTITAAGTFDSIRWNTNENTPNINVDGSRTPISIIVYENGCAGKDTILVKKQIITSNFSNNFLCLNKPITFNNTSTVNTGTLNQYDWKYGDGNSDINVQNPTHTFSPFGNYTVQLIATSDIGCKDTIVKTIAMDTVLNVNFNKAELISCQRKAVDFVNLTTGGFNNQNTWRIETSNIITKNASYAFTGTGLFPVKLVVSNRCYADSITKNIQIRPRPSVDLGRDTVLCKNQTTSFTVNPASYDSIRWVNGSTAATFNANGSINPLKIKVYFDGCIAEDTVNVNAPKFTLNFTNDFICYNKPITFNNISSVSYGTVASFNWNFGDGQSVTGVKNPSHTYNIYGPKRVQLFASGNTGCRDTFVKTVSMDDSIFFSVNPVPDDVCYGRSVQYTNLSTGGVNTAYVWSLNNVNQQTGNTATYTHTFAGANTIKLVATHRCGADSTKFNFTVLPLPRVNLGDDSIIMCPGELKMIGINQTADSIFWSTGDRDKDSIAIDGLTSPIKVEVYNNGCLAKDSIFVSTNCDVFIPTAFSPNNDGFNDLFNMINKSIKSYTLKIFNRWGELVFETNDLNSSWDGTCKGAVCPQDNYTYISSGVRFNNEPFYLKGIMTLLR